MGEYFPPGLKSSLSKSTAKVYVLHLCLGSSSSVKTLNKSGIGSGRSSTELVLANSSSGLGAGQRPKFQKDWKAMLILEIESDINYFI